jgi:hypothetical protein
MRQKAEILSQLAWLEKYFSFHDIGDLYYNLATSDVPGTTVFQRLQMFEYSAQYFAERGEFYTNEFHRSKVRMIQLSMSRNSYDPPLPVDAPMTPSFRILPPAPFRPDQLDLNIDNMVNSACLILDVQFETMKSRTKVGYLMAKSDLMFRRNLISEAQDLALQARTLANQCQLSAEVGYADERIENVERWKRTMTLSQADKLLKDLGIKDLFENFDFFEELDKELAELEEEVIQLFAE